MVDIIMQGMLAESMSTCANTRSDRSQSLAKWSYVGHIDWFSVVARRTSALTVSAMRA